MYILRAAEGETVERSDAPIFEGQVWGRALTGDHSDMVTASVVSFAAGARAKLHRHTSDQVLHVVSGIGQVGDADGDHVIAVGDTVVIPAGVDHWHGAGDTGSPMSHLTIMRAGSETTVL
jgi:quercetin dioxygenase-like cupin family protein